MFKNNFSKFLKLVLLTALLITSSSSGAALAEDAGDIDLTVGLNAPLHVPAGGEFVVNLSYSNLGEITSPEDTWVELDMPEGVSFVSALDREGNPMPPDELDGQKLRWNVGEIYPSLRWDHIWITESVTEDLPEQTSLINAAVIGSSAEDANLENNQATVTSLVCQMGGSYKRANMQEAKPGDQIEYQIRVRMNHRMGQDVNELTEIVVTDILPPKNQVRFLGWIGAPGGEYNGETLQWRLKVRAGEWLTLRYRLGVAEDIPGGVQLTNRVRIKWQDQQIELEPAVVSIYQDGVGTSTSPGGVPDSGKSLQTGNRLHLALIKR